MHRLFSNVLCIYLLLGRYIYYIYIVGPDTDLKLRIGLLGQIYNPCNILTTQKCLENPRLFVLKRAI